MPQLITAAEYSRLQERLARAEQLLEQWVIAYKEPMRYNLLPKTVSTENKPEVIKRYFDSLK